MKDYIQKLQEEHCLTKEEFTALLSCQDKSVYDYAREQAAKIRQQIFGRDIYIRGLIEISNHCKNDCYYCGIRRSNRRVSRYRLTHSQILDCCQEGHELGFRTFVLQGGEDPWYTDQILTDVVRDIKKNFPDCAVTLSLGERSRESYEKLYAAGADRYLLRHETASEEHYRKLHPDGLSLQNRKECLWNLKKIGFQTGAGFMVGSPGQTVEHLAKDLLFLRELSPQMVGVGPFLRHQDTPFADQPNGSLQLTLFLLSLIRLMLPKTLLPATTALSALHPDGRKLGILAGCNVVMPNLSPTAVREKYLLYDHKPATGLEAAESIELLKKQMKEIGYQVVCQRGDYPQSE
ncbi:MAG: [FeFe] hydrogenase H-cluster radical SAM maturase HydE [Lachnospiraceae bacterium]|nr:[FeFe] hydrogenase H-cluster radical SAM maturase HydE [Lachnospiraceae bacterium]